MQDFDTHTRHLADVEASFRNARQRDVPMPNASMQVISVLVGLAVAGAVIGVSVA